MLLDTDTAVPVGLAPNKFVTELIAPPEPRRLFTVFVTPVVFTVTDPTSGSASVPPFKLNNGAPLPLPPKRPSGPTIFDS